MDRNSVDWKGYIPAVTTPFKQDGALDLAAWGTLLEWFLAESLHGIIVAGTTGEWFSIERDELVQLLRRAGSLLAGRMTLIAGCNSYTAHEALAKATLAKEAGFDGILLTPPPYIRPTEFEIEQFYRDVSDACPLPICVYNWPPGTNIDMSLPLLRKICALPKVVAVKNSTPSKEHFTNVMQALHKDVRIFGIPSNDEGINMIRAGLADGVMGAGAVLGRDHPAFFNAIWAGDLEAARKFGARDRKIMEDWFNQDYTGRFGSAQSVLKAALNLRGLPGGWPRRPLLPLDEVGIEQVRQTLEDLSVPLH